MNEIDARDQQANVVLSRRFDEVFGNNFTRDATIVANRISTAKPKLLAVRAKVDTGCDENLVSYDTLVLAGINQEQFVPIQKEHSIEFGGVEGFKFTPDF